MEAARHPGVIELVGVEGTPDRPILVTAPVDGPSLAAFGPLAAEELAGLTAALASTLADLHDLGIVHGSVDADHVLVGDDGRPVLCGFDKAGHAGEVPPGAVAELDPAGDVAGLGHVLRRFAMGVDARPLRRLADEATAEDTTARPSARALAAELATALPGTRLPMRPSDERSVEPDPRPGTLERRRPAEKAGTDRRRLRPAVVIGAGVAVVAAVAMLVLSRTPAGPQPAIVAPPFTLPPAVSTTVATTSTRPAARQDCAEVSSVLLADVDGDGCLDALRYADGVVEAAGRRWSVGQAGDVAATGDWSCRGVRTLALLRPSTGEVFPLAGWDGEVTARAAARVEGGQALRAADVDRDGCHELVVERGALPAEVLHLSRVQP